MFAQGDTVDRRLYPFPLIVAAAISLFLLQSGFLAFLFLIPLGFITLMVNGKTGWAAAAAVVLLNGLFSLFARFMAAAREGAAQAGGGLTLFGTDILVTVVLAVPFMWSMLPHGAGLNRIRPVWRMIAGAGIVFATSLILLFGGGGEFFDGFMAEQVKAAASMYGLPQEGALSAEKLAALIKQVILKGGGYASCLCLFFLSREASRSLAWRRIRRRGLPAGPIGLAADLKAFHAGPAAVWALSLSLGAVLTASFFKLETAEIAAWNALAAFAAVFLAQGMGIVLVFLSRLSGGPRFTLTILLVVLLVFSPGINAILWAAIMLLGVAENWAVLRPPHNGNPSTPEV